MHLNHFSSLELLHIKKCSLLNWLSILPQFHLSLPSFLIKSSHLLIFRFGRALSIINALFKNSESVHAFFYSTSIGWAANKCQATKRTQRWLRLSLSLNCISSPTGDMPSSVPQVRTMRARLMSRDHDHTRLPQDKEHPKRRRDARKEHPDGSGIRCSELRGQMFAKAQKRREASSGLGQEQHRWAGVPRPHTGLLVSSSEDSGLHPESTREPFSLARYYSINFRNLHQFHYSQSAISKLNRPYSTLLRLWLPHSCILKILYVICK